MRKPLLINPKAADAGTKSCQALQAAHFLKQNILFPLLTLNPPSGQIT